ncbi:hypothetical protein PFISCL1PPCAC_15028, partial [Pristionchus fissidentatus]
SFLLLFSLLLLIEISHCTQCYYGNILSLGHGQMDGTSKVKLMTCPKTHRCCSKVTSNKGVSLQCAKDCPAKKPSCGPEGKSAGNSDASWCFCKNHRDKNCQP